VTVEIWRAVVHRSALAKRALELTFGPRDILDALVDTRQTGLGHGGWE
jgi:hypothetical protein